MATGGSMRKETLLDLVRGLAGELRGPLPGPGDPDTPLQAVASTLNLHMVELNNIYGEDFNSRFPYLDPQNCTRGDILTALDGIIAFISSDLGDRADDGKGRR